LEGQAREFMESRFGHDFGQVRVHSDARAAASAQAVNALAYTVGRNIVFAQGQYAPGTAQGRRVLAHELTHAVQQGLSARQAPGTLAMTDHADRAEQEAEAAAQAIEQAQPFNATHLGQTQLARQKTPGVKTVVSFDRSEFGGKFEAQVNEKA